MAEQKEYFLAVYMPYECFKGKHDKDEIVYDNMTYSLREIDKFTSNFVSKKQLLMYSIDRICENKDNVHGATISAYEVIKEYEKRKMNTDYCIKIGKYDNRKMRNTYNYDFILSDYYEMIELNKGNRVPMKQMIVHTACDDNFVKNILDKYYLKVVSKKQLEDQFSFLNLNKKEMEILTNSIMDLVKNDEVDKEKLKEILKIKINDKNTLNYNINNIIVRSKITNSLRKKVEKLDESLQSGNCFMGFIDFATDITNECKNYLKCRNMYLHAKKYNENIKDKNKVKTK